MKGHSSKKKNSETLITDAKIAGEIPSVTITILLVDDQKLNHKVASKVLPSAFAPFSVAIIPAYSGEEAIEQIKQSLNSQQTIDLVFMDNEMGKGLSGDETTTFIRTNYEEFCAPILTFSTNYKGQYLHADGYVAKPMAKHDLEENTIIEAVKEKVLKDQQYNMFRLFHNQKRRQSLDKKLDISRRPTINSTI